MLIIRKFITGITGITTFALLTHVASMYKEHFEFNCTMLLGITISCISVSMGLIVGNIFTKCHRMFNIILNTCIIIMDNVKEYKAKRDAQLDYLYLKEKERQDTERDKINNVEQLIKGIKSIVNPKSGEYARDIKRYLNDLSSEEFSGSDDSSDDELPDYRVKK